jgi:hypothetical protein
MTVPARPHAITLIAWLAILYGVLTLGVKIFVVLSPEAFAMAREVFIKLNERPLVPLPFEAHMAHGFISSIVFVVAGVFMLLGHNWARLLFLIWPLTALALTVVVSGLSLSLGLKTLTYCVLAFFLLRTPCVRYFRTAPDSDASGEG